MDFISRFLLSLLEDTDEAQRLAAVILKRVLIGIGVSILLAIAVLTTSAAYNWPRVITLIGIVICVAVGMLLSFTLFPMFTYNSYSDSLLDPYRGGNYLGLMTLTTVTTVGAASGVAFLFVQLALATLPIGIIVLAASLLSVVAYIFIVPEGLPYRQRQSEAPQPQRTRPVSSGGLNRWAEALVGRMSFVRFAFYAFFAVCILAALFLVMSPGIDEKDKDLAVSALGAFVGLGVGSIGAITVLFAVAVCFYGVFGPGLEDVRGKEIFYTLIAAGMNGFFPWLQKNKKVASLLIALAVVPVCFYVVFVSELKGFYEKCAGFVLLANIVIIFRHLQRFVKQ